MVAFSIVFNKPFFISDGLKNKRTKYLLELTGLENRSITTKNIDEKLAHTFNSDYSKANQILRIERKKSLDYLINALK